MNIKEINSNAVHEIARANNGLAKRIEELELENEQLRMRLAEIPDILDKIDQETPEGCSLVYCKARNDTLSELRRLLVD